MSVPESNICRLGGADPIHAAVTMARAFGDLHGLSPESAARLAILVEELLMNLLDHAGVAAGDRIELGLVREAGAVRLVLLDPGASFDPRESPGGGDDDDTIPDRGGGAGLAMLRAWSQVLDYRSDGGVNRLDLRIPDISGL